MSLYVVHGVNLLINKDRPLTGKRHLEILLLILMLHVISKEGIQTSAFAWYSVSLRFEFRYNFNISPFCGPGYLKIINFLLCAVQLYGLKQVYLSKFDFTRNVKIKFTASSSTRCFCREIKYIRLCCIIFNQANIVTKINFAIIQICVFVK